MELRQLRYFEAVARTLNFSKAADELYIAQPPLSRQIKNLEEELGVTLIDRSSRPLTLTDSGKFFYEQATQLIARIEEVKKATQRIAAEQKKRIGVGFVPTVLYSRIPSAIHQFTTEHQDIEVSLAELTSIKQAEALLSGRIDIGFGRLSVAQEGIRNIILTEDKLVAAVATESPLAKSEKLTLLSLVEEKLLLYPAAPRPSFADQVLRQFKIRGLDPANIFETNGLQTTIGLVAAGMGVTLVPESVKLLQRADITYIDLDEEGVTSPLIMSVRTNTNPEQVMRFRTYVESLYH